MPRIKRHQWGEWMDYFMVQLEDDRPKLLAVDTETSGLAFHDRA